MKFLKIIALLCLFSAAARAQIVTGTLTITNPPVNTSTFTVSGKVFTWTNGNPVGPNAILITNTFGGDATNLFNVAGLVLPFSGVTLTNVSSNVVAFSGIGVTGSVTASWATFALTTNGTAPATNVVVPISVYDSAARAPVESQLVADINTYNTTPLATNTPAVANLVDLANVQTITGPKTFTGVTTATNASNSLTGNFLGNIQATTPAGGPNMLYVYDFGAGFTSGEDIACTNIDASAVSFYSSTDYTLPLSQWTLNANTPIVNNLGGGKYRWIINTLPGSATYYIAIAGSSVTPLINFGLLQLTPTGGGAFSSSYPVGAWQSGIFSGSFGLGSGGDLEIHDAQNQNRIQVQKQNANLVFNYTNGNVALLISGNVVQVFDTNDNPTITISNGVVISGNGNGWTNLNATNLAGKIQQAQIPTNASYIGTFGGVLTGTNLTTSGTNTLGGALAFTKYANTALVNGYNADINVGTNPVLIISGPTGLFTNVGFVAGVDQQQVTVKNYTGQTMTFLDNNTGLESVAANRLNLGYAYSNTFNPGIVTLQYNGAISKWEMISHN